MKKIIEIKNLKKYFKDVKAVDGISFNVKEGELFAFLGLNGAGKSTTINIMCGSLDKDEGQIIIDDKDVDRELNGIKESIGIVFQNSVLDKNLSAYDNLKTRALLYGMSKESFNDKLNELIELLDLKDILKRPLGKLSGGEKRRIDIARALIHSPKILILDEPTTGLDPQTRIMVWNVLNYLRKETNLTIFLTTHYMEEASEADYVVILDRGKIVASGTVNDLKNKYASDVIKIYFNETNKKDLEGLFKKKKVKYVENKECFEVEVKSSKEAKEMIINNSNLFNDFEVIKGKMDNVFLNVTGKDIKEVI